MSRRLVDMSPNRGVYEGDLKYGRCNGNVPEFHKDFPADPVNGEPRNKPVIPLKLVQPRDQRVWQADSLDHLAIKMAKQSMKKAQTKDGINYLRKLFQEHEHHLRANFHLTIKSKL